MCGIAGWLGQFKDGEQFVPRVARALRHRGPDANGSRSWPEAGLIHTRLSIIDLSPTGAQPMANEDGTVWTVFNGEIYNHRELRRDLEARGHVFRGRSDTEVLPHLYEEEGPKFVRRLRGMFALAIYDSRNKTLMLARDRFGIKPLFYAPLRDRLMFASTIAALRQLPGIDESPDPQAISDFAALFYIPAPQTFYKGIRAVQPGEILEAAVDPHGISIRTSSYHPWRIAPNPTLTLAAAEERVASLLMDGVRLQMESDVPLGALLSGGIDSSLVSAAAQASSSDALLTFNVRFPDREYDETWAARAVSEHIGSRHETLDIDDMPGTWEHISDLLSHAGQPFADTSLFAANAVCRLMRRHVKVALSGDGGDEAFGGYALHRQIASIARWQTVPGPIWQGASIALAPLERVSAIPARLPQRIKELAGADDTSVIQTLLCWVRPEEHRRLCADMNTLPVRRLFERQWEYDLPAGSSRLERLSAHATEIYTRLVLPNDFLFKVDTASMRESLEVRVPLLDEELFDFGLSLPHSLKVRKSTGKRVLRAVANRWLPEAVAAKRKQGFAIPVDRWVSSEFKAQMRHELLGGGSRLPDVFRPAVYRPYIEAFCDGRPCSGVSREGLYQRAIMLLSLQLMLDTTSVAAR